MCTSKPSVPPAEKPRQLKVLLSRDQYDSRGSYGGGYMLPPNLRNSGTSLGGRSTGSSSGIGVSPGLNVVG